jgi:hypothetical protein
LQNSKYQRKYVIPKSVHFLRISLVLIFGFFLTGCVSTHLTSHSSKTDATPISRVVLVYVPGTFSDTNNIAARLGARNLYELLPHLKTRLVPMFNANGLIARMSESEAGQPVRFQDGEMVMTLKAIQATYNSRAGQALDMEVSLVNPRTQKTLWRGSVRMFTMGYGSFDESVADSIGTQVLKALNENGMLTKSFSQSLGNENLLTKPIPASSSVSDYSTQSIVLNKMSSENIINAQKTNDSIPAKKTSELEISPTKAELEVGKRGESAEPRLPEIASQSTGINTEFRSKYQTNQSLKIYDLSKLPNLSSACKIAFEKWLTRRNPRGFAISDTGACAHSVGVAAPEPSLPTDPAERALLVCNKSNVRHD